MFSFIRNWFSTQQPQEQQEEVAIPVSTFESDKDEFTAEECNRIRSAHFPEVLRENLRMEKKMAARKAWLESMKSDANTESFLGTGGGGSSSDC